MALRELERELRFFFLQLLCAQSILTVRLYGKLMPDRRYRRLILGDDALLVGLEVSIGLRGYLARLLRGNRLHGARRLRAGAGFARRDQRGVNRGLLAT